MAGDVLLQQQMHARRVVLTTRGKAAAQIV